MHLNPAQIQTVLRRCQRRRRLQHGLAAAEDFSRLAWPGLAVALVVLIGAGGSATVPVVVGSAVALWLAFSLGWMWLRRRKIPAWRLPAYVDRQAGAKGALLRAFETGDAGEVPISALQVRLPALFPRRLAAVWTVLLAGYLTWYLLPPAPPAVAMQTVPSWPVRQAQDALDSLASQRPADDPFIAAARQTLDTLSRRNDGLAAEDFAALDLVRRQTAESARATLAARREQNAEWQAVADALARHESGALDTPSAARALNQSAQALAAEGQIDAAAAKTLLATAQALNAQPGGAGGGERDPAAMQSLRELVEREQARLAQDMEQLGACLTRTAEAAGVTRGPGTLPLAYDHLTFQRRDARFDALNFSAREGGDTVLLAAGMSKRPEEAGNDAQNLNARTFQEGTDTRYWQKHGLPRHRAVLENYFNDFAASPP